MGLTCTPIIDINSLIQPLLLKNIFTGGEFNLDPLIDAMVQDKIEESLLANVNLPSEFADLGDVICLSLEMNKVKTVLAALKGEQVSPEEGLDKVIQLIVNLQMLSALSSSLGGGTA